MEYIYEEKTSHFLKEQVLLLKEFFIGENFAALTTFNNNFKDTQDFLESLQTNTSGLTYNNIEQLEKRRRDYGSNLPFIKRTDFLKVVQIQLNDKIIRMYLILSILSLIFGICEKVIHKLWIQSTEVLLLIVLFIFLKSCRIYLKEKILNLLEEENLKKKVIVRRNNSEINIDIKDLVVGDILKVQQGDIIPVDGIIIEGKLTVDESMHKGNDNVNKTPIVLNEFYDKVTPFCIARSYIKQGQGFIVVCAVGKNLSNPFKVIINKSTFTKTKLTLKLEYLFSSIEEFCIYLGSVVFLCLFLKELSFRIYFGRNIISIGMINYTLNCLLLANTLILIGIPESLQLAQQYSTILSLSALKDKGVLIRNIEVTELLAKMNYFIYSKSRLITYPNSSQVKKIFFENKILNMEDVKSLKNEQSKIRKKKSSLDLLFKSIVNNFDSNNKIDSTLFKFILDLDISTEQYQIDTIDEKKYLHFNSENKISASVLKTKEGTFDKTYLFVKAAPEIFFQSEDGIYNIYGCDDIENHMDLLKQTQLIFEEDGFCTILVLYKEIFEDEIEGLKDSSFLEWENVMKDLTVIALVAIEDKIINQEKIFKQMRDSMGINVLMATGSSINYAIANSLKLGYINGEDKLSILRQLVKKEELEKKSQEIKKEIDKIKREKLNKISSTAFQNDRDMYDFLNKQDKTLKELDNKLNEFESLIIDPLLSINGNDFLRLTGGYEEYKEEFDFSKQLSKSFNLNLNLSKRNDQKRRFTLKNIHLFEKIISQMKIIYRCSPLHKLLVAIGMKENNFIVGAVGSEATDYNLLKYSDIGFALEAGCDVSKDSSDLRLLDSSLENIYTSIRYSRNINDNVKKIIQFNIISIILTGVILLIGGIVVRAIPLNSIQLLWVKIIIEFISSYSLLNEEPQNIDRRINIKEKLISKFMLFNITIQTFFQIIIILTIIFYGEVIFTIPSDRKRTYEELSNEHGSHFTILFSVFVYFLVFNTVNSRKIRREEKNVFSGIKIDFVILQIGVIIMQIFLTTYCGSLFRSKALSLRHNIICFVIGLSPLVIGLIIKFLPYFSDDETKNDNYRSLLK